MSIPKVLVLGLFVFYCMGAEDSGISVIHLQLRNCGQLTNSRVKVILAQLKFEHQKAPAHVPIKRKRHEQFFCITVV